MGLPNRLIIDSIICNGIAMFNNSKHKSFLFIAMYASISDLLFGCLFLAMNWAILNQASIFHNENVPGKQVC